MISKRLVFAWVVLFAIVFFRTAEASGQNKSGKPVDVVICMDLSSSTNGLIDHMRNHLWDYWYFFSRCQPLPDYRIGIVVYSRFSYGKQNGYSRVLKDLGTDFEPLSAQMFRIPSRIERGDQYVGAALLTCANKISWSKNPNALKMVFLVGNGDVKLGGEDVDLAIEKLVAQNVIVNTIYCTVPGERKVIREWQRIAENGRGKMTAISLRNRYFDRLNGFNMKRFRALNRHFNNTYLFYGQGGAKRWRLLQEEDNHIYVTNTEGYRYRALYKISDDYQKKNSRWDLVDLYTKNPVAYMDVDRKLLNDTCRKMTKDQLKAYIIYKKYERKKLSAMIADMVAEKELKDKEDGKVVEKNMATLDVVIIKMIRDALRERGCECIY
ncbi:MAG: VWA domain-containing protein [Bacteroidia bacterium]|nr:VWA domain-containing protein [Bacteroidia bacterium]